MGNGALRNNPFIHVVLRLREVQGFLEGPDAMRGGTVRDLVKTMQISRRHLRSGGSLAEEALPP
eukprot:11957003-Alexandrium_andersonii.AAC.1